MMQVQQHSTTQYSIPYTRDTAIEMQQELRALQGGLDFIVAYRDILWDMKMFAVF